MKNKVGVSNAYFMLPIQVTTEPLKPPKRRVLKLREEEDFILYTRLSSSVYTKVSKRYPN